MKIISKVIVTGASLFVALNLLQAQTQFSGQAVQAGSEVSAQPDSIVQLTAEAQGLNLISPSDLPDGGTFWTLMPDGLTAPFPCAPNDPNVPMYQIADGQFIVDATGGQVTLDAEQTNRSTVTAALETLAQTVVNLIDQVQEAQVTREIMAVMGLDEEVDSAPARFGAMQMSVANQDALWLEITNVTHDFSYYNLHNATNQVYAIQTKPSLPGASWNIEAELWPTGDQTNVLPFALANYGRDTLFVRAEDWTGVDSNSDGVPDWWLWEYFGTLALNATNLDGDGNTLLADYTNNVVPHTFSFTGITVTNNYVSTTTPAVQLAVTGYPYYVAVLVDDTNLNNAAWNTYSSSTVAVNLGLTEGWHEVQIGLRGYADAATNAVWQWKWLNLDYTSPQLAITQPASGTVSVPMIQVHGYASEALASITYDISNAAGIFTGQTGYLADEFWDANLLAFTTNYFQCYDVALTNGLNQIAVHVFDLAGNETTSNLNITVNYAGDTVAPALTLLWPTNGTPVSGASFTLQAQVDDYTATVTASFVDTNGVTNTVTALVERSGLVWAGLPLTSGTNTFALTIADAAGNVTVTNLTVTRNDAGLTMNPLTDGQLNQSSVSVTGTVGDASYSVTVNGVAATVSSNLTWVADNVPVNLVDTASLEVVVRDSVGNLVTTHDYAQPLSAKIRLMSYSGYRHFQTAVYMNNYFVEDETVNWEHSEGGSWNYNAVNEYHNLYLGSSTYLISADGKTVALPEFDLYDLPPIFLWPVFHDFLGFQNGNSFNPPWEYSSLANGNLQRSLRTQVMIEPQGQAPLHTTKVYLVRAEAKEFSAPFNNSVPDPATANFSYLMFCTSNSLNGTGLPEMNPTNYVGDVPLPPEWLRINGQPLNRTTITNADGTVEGVMLLSAPAGVNVPLTVTATQVHQYQDYTFNVTLGKTKEDWQQMVQQEIDGDSGVAVENYLAGNGFLNNRANIQAVYAFYQKLFTEQSTEFYWAGLAKLAGAPVYAGLSDAQHGYDLLASMVSTNSPYDATNNLETMASIQNLQNTLIGMNIAILNDLAWQFEAYKNGGLDALKEIDAVDPTHTILDIASWQKIDQGIQTSNSSLIQQGNKDLLQREQQQVLAFGYQQLSAIPNVTAIMSLLAKNPVPGGPDFATLEPSGSIAIFNDRWDWIIHSSNGMWPLWISANSATQLGWVAVPLTTYATNYILIPPVIQ